MPLPLDMLQAIDDRVRSGERNVTAMGTVVERTFDDNAQVVFDGSQGPVPVKVSGDVEAYPGDRVGLVKFGRWWIVVVSMAKRWPADNGATLTPTTGYSTGAFSFADVPEIGAFPFVKRWNATRVKSHIDATAKSSAGLSAEWAFKFTSDMGSLEVPVAWLYYDLTTLHLPACGTKYTLGAATWDGVGLPAGEYQVQMRWRSPHGGNINISADDRISGSCAEVAP